MAYDVSLDGVLMPIAPSKIEVKIKNQNKSINLINDGEVNILKSAGLTSISFEVMIPQNLYPFATYENGFERASYFLKKFESLKINKKPFQFICSRKSPSGKLLFDTDLKVSLEEYRILDNAKNGIDIMVAIKLKEYRERKITIINIPEPRFNTSSAPVVATVKIKRPDETSPAPQITPKTYKVIAGDTLWKISKKFYGDGSKYPKIFNANKDKIKNPNLIWSGQVLIIPV